MFSNRERFVKPIPSLADHAIPVSVTHEGVGGMALRERCCDYFTSPPHNVLPAHITSAEYNGPMSAKEASGVREALEKAIPDLVEATVDAAA